MWHVQKLTEYITPGRSGRRPLYNCDRLSFLLPPEFRGLMAVCLMLQSFCIIRLIFLLSQNDLSLSLSVLFLFSPSFPQTIILLSFSPALAWLKRKAQFISLFLYPTVLIFLCLVPPIFNFSPHFWSFSFTFLHFFRTQMFYFSHFSPKYLNLKVFSDLSYNLFMFLFSPLLLFPTVSHSPLFQKCLKN